MKLLSVLLVLATSIAASALADQTFPIPAGATVTVNTAARTVTIHSSDPPAPTAPATPPASSPTWGYTNGTYSWGGDFTLNGTSVDYHHATASGLGGHTQDILFTSKVSWGLFLPYFAPGASGYKYPNPGYKSLLISVKPTKTGQAFGIYFTKTGDVPTGCNKELLSYGPPTVAGVWGSYVIPLQDMCVASDKDLYKFGLQDHANSGSSWEMDNIGFE